MHRRPNPQSFLYPIIQISNTQRRQVTTSFLLSMLALSATAGDHLTENGVLPDPEQGLPCKLLPPTGTKSTLKLGVQFTPSQRQRSAIHIIQGPAKVDHRWPRKVLKIPSTPVVEVFSSTFIPGATGLQCRWLLLLVSASLGTKRVNTGRARHRPLLSAATPNQAGQPSTTQPKHRTISTLDNPIGRDSSSEDHLQRQNPPRSPYEGNLQ